MVRRALSVVALAAIVLAGCPSSHDPEDPRPLCPDGDDFVRGNACNEQDECESSTCGRLAGVCVEYKWTCGQCGVCFFEQVEHVEDSFLPCNPDTGLCEY